MSISRADRSRFGSLWFTMDRTLLTAILSLFAVGLVVSLAATPAVADRKGFEPFHFVERHIVFALVGVVVMFTFASLSAREIRRLAGMMFVGCLGLMGYVLWAGPEINGARRWLIVAGFSMQPSELAKPAFIILTAWLLAERQRKPDMPTGPVMIALFVPFVFMLRLQPDIGQTMLVVAVWGALLVLGGLSLAWPLAAGALAAAILGFAYATQTYVQKRIDAFLSGDVAANMQTERAMRSFSDGGFLGLGPGAGSIKTDLPDAHTDFILAVIAEEYGAVSCLALLGLYAFIVFRAMARGIAREDLYVRFSLFGLALLFGGQALINMAVNVGLLPAKGMTLPLISAGGSSMIAVSITLGLILSFARRTPDTRPLRHVPFVVTPTAGELADEGRRE
ncbi:MAG: putative peptidoglycan glycosyltransferase FtsW [Pseudomonadota bacterium]